MYLIEKEQLKLEIQHIFDSGANEIRIFEMVKSFIESRPIITNPEKLSIRDEFAKSALMGLVAKHGTPFGESSYILRVKESYKIADEMLKEREL